MEITLYSDFSKRNNSTKNPDTPGAISVSVTLNVALKEQCSKIKPSFFITNITDFVYCKAWDWYYYITNIAYDINGAQYIECELDVLGTWRDDIMSTRAFVKYSSNKFNEFIKDERICTTGKMISKSSRLSLDGYISEQETYTYLLTTYSCDEEEYGNNGIRSYYLTNAEMTYLIQALFVNGESFFGSIEQSFDDLKNAIIDISCIPFAVAETMGEQCEVIIGKYNTHCMAHGASTEAVIINDGLPLSNILNKNDFRVMEPYTYCRLYLPFVGLVDISPEELQNAGALFFTIISNILTRKITYIVYVGSGNVTDNNAKILGIYHGTFGIQIPIAYLYNDNAQGFITDAFKAGGSAAMVVGGAMSGNGVVAAMGAASLIQSEVSAFMKANTLSTSMIGGLSGNYGWSTCPYIKLEVFTPEVSAEPSSLAELYGRPLLQVSDMSELTGYVETKGFEIDISAPKSIKDKINDLMDSGVYLE